MDFSEDQEVDLEKDEKTRGIAALPTNHRSPKRLRILLDTYAKTGRLIHACRTAGVNHNTHYRKLQNDPDYRASFEAAERQCIDLIQDELFRRAIDGESDALLMFLARGFMPDKYRDRASVEHSGSVEIVDRLQSARRRLIAMRPDDDAAANG